MRDEGSLPLVAILNVDIVISPADVKLSKQFSVFEFVDEVRDEGERVGVAGSVFVQVSVVLTGAKTAVLLFDEEERGCLGGIGRANLSAI